MKPQFNRYSIRILNRRTRVQIWQGTVSGTHIGKRYARDMALLNTFPMSSLVKLRRKFVCKVEVAGND